MRELPKKYGSWLTINRACNLNCEWCYARGTRADLVTKNMTLEIAQKSIKMLRELPVDRVILIGGEPTIHPNFLTIVKMINNAGLQPALITNGIRFEDEEFLRKTIESGVVGITTSLKGFSESEYQKATGKKRFNSVVTAIKNISKSNIDHNVSITVGDNFLGDFDKIIGLFREIGVKNFSIEMEEPTVINGEASYCGKSSPKSLVNMFVDIYQRIEECDIDFVMKIYAPFCLFPEGFIQELKMKKRILSGCHLHTGSGIIIDPIGKILPCNHFCENSLGELGVDFVTGKEYIDFRKRTDVMDFYNTLSNYPHEKCQECAYWPECGAGCRLNWLCFEANEIINF